MKVFKVGDVVTIKDQYDPECDGSDYPHVLPSSCKGAIGVITAVCSEAVDPQEKRKKMYNHDDYLYEVEIKITPTLNFNEAFRRVRWHGTCFKEYGSEPDTLLYKKDTKVLVKNIPGVCDWRENYSYYGVIVRDVYTKNKKDFAVKVDNLIDTGRTIFYVTEEDVEPLGASQKSPSVEEQLDTLSKIDDLLLRAEKLTTPPDTPVFEKPIITVSVDEVKITIPKIVLPIIKI